MLIGGGFLSGTEETMSRTLIPAVPAVAVALALLFLASPAAAQVPAPVPSHDVGDKVGFGASIDLGALADPFLAQLVALDQADDNFTFHELNFTGSADIWATMEVIEEVPGAYYTIREEAAAGVRAHFVADVTSTRLPVPGTYQGSLQFGFCVPPAYPMSERRLSLDYQVSDLETTSGASKWGVSDFALRETAANATLDLRIVASIRGFPSATNDTACRFTVSYMDRDLTITADVDTQVRAVYSPAWDIFDFPINDAETWWANSTAAVSGRISGTIDAVGYNATEEEMLFDTLNTALESSGLTVTGLTGFPITLQDITITFLAVPYLENGEIRSFPAPVNQSLQARASQLILADDQLHDVYLLSQPVLIPGLPGCSWIYSPDDGFIVGYICEFAPGVPYFALDNVPADQAGREIDQAKVEYSVTPPAGNPLLDFFLKTPYLGLLLIAAAVIVVAALLVRRGRRPAVAPPSPPPMAPPP